MRIGELSVRTGASVRALRYYEEQALLTPTRTASGQRVYDDTAVERVRMLRRLYAAGLSSSTIASVLPCVDAPSDEVTYETIETLRAERRRIDHELADLTATRDHLGTLIDTVVAWAGETRGAQSQMARMSV
ncbi:MerR family transcriptional regulator [Jatrophihabitans fulvus]